MRRVIFDVVVGIFGIVGTIVAIATYFSPPEVKLELARQQLEDEGDQLTATRAQEIQRSIDAIGEVVRVLPAEVFPNGADFELGRGSGVSLITPNQQRQPFAIGDMYPNGSYVYTGFMSEESRQFSSGETIRFSGSDWQCSITLVGLRFPDQSNRMSGIATFNYSC